MISIVSIVTNIVRSHARVEQRPHRRVQPIEGHDGQLQKKRIVLRSLRPLISIVSIVTDIHEVHIVKRAAPRRAQWPTTKEHEESVSSKGCAPVD